MLCTVLDGIRISAYNDGIDNDDGNIDIDDLL